MKALILSLFGQYQTPIDTVVEYVWNPVLEEFEVVTNFVTPAGVAGLDWVWICGVALFGVTLYCIFRIIGGLLCGRF